jgi:hypothetical protein
MFAWAEDMCKNGYTCLTVKQRVGHFTALQRLHVVVLHVPMAWLLSVLCGCDALLLTGTEQGVWVCGVCCPQPGADSAEGTGEGA